MTAYSDKYSSPNNPAFNKNLLHTDPTLADLTMPLSMMTFYLYELEPASYSDKLTARGTNFNDKYS
jgi:hypothetical protein